MEHQLKEVLCLTKDEAVFGTPESSAFILSLRERGEFSRVHPAGYHTIPHLGTYGQDYNLSLPMVLLSLPPNSRYLHSLPIEVLNSLGLEDFAPNKTNPIASLPICPGPFKPHPLFAEPRASNFQLQMVARKVAFHALLNAYNRMVYDAMEVDDIAAQMETMSINKKSQGDILEHDWSIPKHDSLVSLESEGYVSASSGLSFSQNSSVVSFSQRVSFVEQSEMDSEEDYEEEIRTVAKKLVKKIVHIAYHKVEALYRKSSIEYLIASTKRMKIAQSPSPPPPSLKEERKSPDRSQQSRLPNPFQLLNRRSPSPEDRLRKLGAKRQRSDSHDIVMLSDQNLTKKFITGKTSGNIEPRQILRARHSGANTIALSQLANIAMSMNQMSIVEESESAESDEDDYIILEATTKPTNPRLQNLTPSPSLILPPKSHDHSPSTNPLPDMDIFVIVHSYTQPNHCQKFHCSNTNEVNLVYHCWLYGDSLFAPDHTLSSQLEMGVFCPQGVESVHLDLQDAGVPFHHLDERTVCIHNCCFSPENAQLQLATPNRHTPFHTFFSVARQGPKKVVAYHVVPGSQLVEELVRRTIGDCWDLRQLLLSFASVFPSVGEKIINLVVPFGQ